MAECSICFNLFGDDDANPRVLPCGHTFCLVCLQHLYDSTWTKKCPDCQQIIPIKKPLEIPVNFTILRMTRSNSQDSFNSKVLSEKMCSIHNNHPCTKWCLSCNMSFCGNCAIFTHLSKPEGNCTTISMTVPKFSEKMIAIKNISQILEHENIIKVTLEQSVSSHLNNNSDDSSEEMLQEFLDSLNQIYQSIENFQKIKNYLILADEESIIEAYLSEADGDIEQVRNIIPKVWATHVCMKIGGCKMYSKLIKCGSSYTIQSLKQDHLPPGATSMPFEEFKIRFKDNSAIMGFFELCYNGKNLGQLVTSMRETSPRTSQFLALCTGELGPSYRGTKLFHKSSFSFVGCQRFIGGDYEHNTGYGGKAIVNGIRDKVNSKTEWNRGVMYGFPSSDHNKLSQFNISLGNSSLFYMHHPFGDIESGLVILDTAVKNNYANKITIKDCGIIVTDLKEFKMPQQSIKENPLVSLNLNPRNRSQSSSISSTQNVSDELSRRLPVNSRHQENQQEVQNRRALLALIATAVIFIVFGTVIRL